MEYLRSKVAQTDDTMEESEEQPDGEGGDDEDEDRGPVQHTDSAYESGDRENKSVSSDDKKQNKAKKTAKQEVTVQTNLHIEDYCFIVSVFWFIPTCVCCRRSRRQSSQ